MDCNPEKDASEDHEELEPKENNNAAGDFRLFAWENFLERRKLTKRIENLCRNATLASRYRASEYNTGLRNKFVAQALSYLGTPYASRYRKIGTPKAPLYLDCCGLVRQTLLDLKDLFGFVVGPWNQAYLYDTLPVVLRENEAIPGDLVFYEAQNYEMNKAQKHGIVHVEIFLGKGIAGNFRTIGSRYQKGCVSIWPSYKFHSPSWGIQKHHFRSIDTWLDGRCKSVCADHPWSSEAVSASGGISGGISEEDYYALPVDEYPQDEEEIKAMHDAYRCATETFCVSPFTDKNFEDQIRALYRP